MYSTNLTQGHKKWDDFPSEHIHQLFPFAVPSSSRNISTPKMPRASPKLLMASVATFCASSWRKSVQICRKLRFQ